MSTPAPTTPREALFRRVAGSFVTDERANELLDAFAAEVRAAAFSEGADAIDALIEELAFREHVSGARARDLLRRLAAAAAPTTTPTPEELNP